MLVKGGTGGMDAGNRTYEPAYMLPTVDESICSEYEERMLHTETVEDIRAVLLDLSEQDYNIVGTRDYVYRSNKMLALLNHAEQMDVTEHRKFQWNLFTRGLFLRKQVLLAFNMIQPGSQAELYNP